MRCYETQLKSAMDFPSSLCRNCTGEKLFVRPYDKTHLAMKRLQCFIAYHRKTFTENTITFHGLRHTFAHEQYNKFIEQGYSDFVARKKVSDLLGHHRDDVTRIYLSGGDDV